jgi:hypothetical protein
MLLVNRVVASSSTFLVKVGRLRPPLLPGGTALQLKSPFPVSSGYMGKSKKLERLGPVQPLPCSLLSGKSPELQYSGLFRVQLQAELGKTLGNFRAQYPCVLFSL